jgi:SAM-dependent methyltransferase/ferredoxin
MCTQCQTLYALNKVPYITNICSPNNCSSECSGACSYGAIEHHGNGLVAIAYDKCRLCSHCASACPLKAIVGFWTPFFTPASGMPAVTAEKVSVQKEGIVLHDVSGSHLIRFRPNEVLLNYSNSTSWMSIAVDNYEFIKDHLSELSFIIFDNGCLNNSFKTYLEECKQSRFIVVSGDVKLYSEWYLDRYFSPVEFLYNGKTLPLATGTVDVVTSNFVLEHVSDPHTYLQEIRRVLKKDGVLFLSVPTPRWFIGYFLKNFWSIYPAHLKNDFRRVVKHPVRDFLSYNAHEKDWNKEKEDKITFIDEIKRWKIKNWDDLFSHNGFITIEKKLFGNAFSLARKTFFFNRPLFNFIFNGSSCVYILMKR